MASTNTLARTINYAQQYLDQSPLTFTTPVVSNDPAFYHADWVMQMILAPPFAWRWNRSAGSFSTPTFTTQIGLTDYKVNIPTFGWIEKAVVYDPSNGNAPMELMVEGVRGLDPVSNEPNRISAQYDDGAGNITFRVFPAPQMAYNVIVDYQNAASIFTSATQPWAPLPDYMSYLYNTGFLAKSMEYWNDPRYQMLMQLFLQQLISASEGLSETYKNIWLDDKMNYVRQSMAVQQGKR